MMNRLENAARLALEALIVAAQFVRNDAFVTVMMARDAINDALREALAEQQAAEPVTFETVYETIIKWDEGGGKRSRRELARRIVALYAAPAQQPLTSWQRRQIIMSVKTVGEAIDMVEAIHNITRPTQQPLTELSPEFTDTARAALLWVLWHHQGGSSPVGQPIRFALGMGAHDRLTDQQISEAKRWDSLDPKPAHGITGSKKGGAA